MKFWIVTPSYNQLEWLKLCVASVRDQVAPDGNEVDGCSLMVDRECAKRSSKADGAKNRLNEPILVHHHIQDAQSTDGTAEWLAAYIAHQPTINPKQSADNFPQENSDNGAVHYQLSFASEADEGMYDAINRGWKLAPDGVDIIAHLNCDEQYLPDALRIIADFMKSHPKTDIVLADMIVVDRDGNYICHRRSLKPYPLIAKYACAGFTAATFQRAAVIQENGILFDTQWKNIGDKVWYNTLLRAGLNLKVCNELVSVFTETDDNLNWTNEGLQEKERYDEEILKNNHAGYYFVSKLNGLRRLAKELFHVKPSAYSLFRSDHGERIHYQIERQRGNWHKTWTGSIHP